MLHLFLSYLIIWRMKAKKKQALNFLSKTYKFLSIGLTIRIPKPLQYQGSDHLWTYSLWLNNNIDNSFRVTKWLRASTFPKAQETFLKAPVICSCHKFRSALKLRRLFNIWSGWDCKEIFALASLFRCGQKIIIKWKPC